MTRNIFYLCLLSLGFASCKKDLAERFNDPDKLNAGITDVVPGLFSRVISNNKIFAQDYGEWYYLLNAGTSITGYAEITNRFASDRYDWFGLYQDLYTGDGFDKPITGQSYFEGGYTRLKPWETIRNELSLRSGQDKTDAQLYFQLVTLVKDYQTAKLVDFYNSVPYSDAFQGSDNAVDKWYPKYDDPKTTYETIITEIGRVADSLDISYAAMSATGRQIFAGQDVVFKGDITKWVKFANATRLKLAVRISGVDADFAKAAIAATLTRSLPDEDLNFPMWFDTDQKDAGGFWMRGLYENTYASFVPNIIMKRLNYGTSAYEPGTDDPRLPVIAMPTKYGDYRGISYDIDSQSVLYKNGERYYPYGDDLSQSLSMNAKSMYNHATLHRNGHMPTYMFSLSELDLLLAEIALKDLGTTGKTAEEHINDAVTHSIDFWYTLNGNSDYKDDPDSKGLSAVLYATKDPTAEAAWATRISTKFGAAASVDDKMEILMQQKYIHLNLLHPYELWAELRRTGHPKMEPLTWEKNVWKVFPERVRYPTGEALNNAGNLSKVSADNNFTSKIFWVPTDRNPVLFWDNYTYE